MRARLLAVALALLSTVASAAPPKAAPKKMTSAELEQVAREAMTVTPPKLPKGATVTGVRCAQIPDVGFTPIRVTVDVTPPPRRTGKVPTSGVIAFWKSANEVGARAPLMIDLEVPALVFDVTKGSPVTLSIQRGLVEVSAPAVASADGDVGDVIQVLLRPSGRALRARVIAKDKVVAVEDAR